MKQSVILLFALFTLFMGTGCAEDYIEKESVVHLIVRGSFVDTLNNPVPGITVSIYTLHNDKNGLRKVWLDPVVTDAEGRFSMETTTSFFVNFYITVEKDGIQDEIGGRSAIGDLRWAKLEQETEDQWDFGTFTYDIGTRIWRF